MERRSFKTIGLLSVENYSELQTKDLHDRFFFVYWKEL